ncbi:MAG TPA: hypothetical protein VG387_20230 [Rhizomicrobium sp.]|jgi:hypothetical protein|nr:hypothetical protein [Rhizomicrobium sp.]
MRGYVKAGAVLVGAAAVLAGLGFGAFQLMNWHFNPEPPPAGYLKPASALEAQRQDVEYFDKLIALDKSFPATGRAEAERRIAALKAMARALPHQMLAVRLMQIAALSDNGHTHLRLFDRARSQLFLPVRVTRFADGFYVMRTRTAHRALLGGRLEAIDGVPFAEVLKRLETLRGGLEVFRRENAALYIEENDLDYGLAIAKAPDKAAWTVRLPDGRVVTQMLEAAPLPKDDDLPYGDRWLSPEPHAGMGADWMAYKPAAGGAEPPSYRDLDRVFENVAIPGSCARYIRIQDIIDVDDQKIMPFLEKTEAELMANPPCAAIVDLRGNGGGNYTNAWHFGHALPKIVKGRIVVLTDADTFSAAITTTAFLKETAGDRMTIVGEPIGDRLAFFAEGNAGVLPNLGIGETYETGKHDYGAPCRDIDVCYWLNWLYPVRVKSLQPDVFVPQSFAAWNAGHDPALDKAVEIAR